MNQTYCGECGSELKMIGRGATVKCCEGLGYWTSQAPSPKDALAHHQLTGQRIVIDAAGGLYLYRKPEWPKGRQAVKPMRKRE